MAVDIEIAKSFQDYGSAFVHLRAGQGEGVQNDLAVFSNVNGAASDSSAHVDIDEAWYEQ